MHVHPWRNNGGVTSTAAKPEEEKMRARRKRLGCQSVRFGSQEAEGCQGASGSDCQGRRAVSTELGMLIGTYMCEHQRYGVDVKRHAEENTK